MRDLWNEGRVLGLSAYEQFVKQFMELNPAGTPPSEREWLAATISAGSSILIFVPVNTGTDITYNSKHYYIVDVPLPTDSLLRAANVIYASPFCGSGQSLATGSSFCQYVSSYGSCLIDNPAGIATDGQSSAEYVIDDPSDIQGLGATDPAQAFSELEFYRDTRLSEYLKIQDGVVLQAGTWTKTDVGSPNLYDFAPDLSVAPVVRLRLTEKLTYGCTILLTGFTYSNIITGVSGVDSSIGTTHPENGDFLGPATYPWAAKIMFTLNTESVFSIYNKISQNVLTIQEGGLTINSHLS